MTSLSFAANVRQLTSTPTSATQIYLMIMAVSEGTVVTYTEVNEDNSTTTFTNQALAQGQIVYGRFHTLSESAGHAKVAR